MNWPFVTFFWQPGQPLSATPIPANEPEPVAEDVPMTPRYCQSCLRTVEVDIVPAKRFAMKVIPAFVICVHCGWCLDVVEPSEPERKPEAS